MPLDQMIQNIPDKLLDAALINITQLGMYNWSFNEKENCYQSRNGSKITPSSLTIKNQSEILHYEYYDGKIDSFFEYFLGCGYWGSAVFKRECSKDKVTLMVTTSEGVHYSISFSADNEDPFIFSVSTVSKDSLEEVSLGYDFAKRLTVSALRQTFGEQRKSETCSRFVSCDKPLEVVSFLLNHPALESILQYFSCTLNEEHYLDPVLIEDFPEPIFHFMITVREKISSNITDPNEEIASVLKHANIAPISKETINYDANYSFLPF